MEQDDTEAPSEDVGVSSENAPPGYLVWIYAIMGPFVILMFFSLLWPMHTTVSYLVWLVIAPLVTVGTGLSMFQRREHRVWLCLGVFFSINYLLLNTTSGALSVAISRGFSAVHLTRRAEELYGR